jgi:hypothetical protein
MPREEYCAVIVENGAARNYTFVKYTQDGSIQQQVREDRSIGQIVTDLTHDGWEFAFQDIAEHVVHIFFKRALLKGRL